MKILYILFFLFFGCDDGPTAPNYEFTCDANYTKFNNYCYFNEDIDVLNSFISNSLASGGLNYNLDDTNNDEIISWHELCSQTWSTGWSTGSNRRLKTFSVFTGSVLPENNCILAGNIPENIGNWTELTYLDLGYHPDPDNTSGLLTGEIPSSMENLTKIENLYLYNNNFSGDIPDIFSGFNNLEILWLCNNYFTGTIPESLWSMENLEILWIEDNQLEGQLSSNISNLISLQKFDIGKNLLTGALPEELYNLTGLKSLYLYDNQFSGVISESISNLINLEVLNLQNNLFEDHLPDDICMLNIDFGASNIDDVYYLGYTWNSFNVDYNKFCPNPETFEYPSCISDYIGEQNTDDCDAELFNSLNNNLFQRYNIKKNKSIISNRSIK